jgi:hypothetical protein
MLAQCGALFSYEFSCNENNGYNNAPHVEMHINRNTQPSYNCYFSVGVRDMPSTVNMHRANYSIIAHGSPELQHHFHTVIAPLIYDATIQNHYSVIPGYRFSDGLYGCVNQLSQFSRDDSVLLSNLKNRLETYCTRIEGIVFNGKNYAFCDNLSRMDQIKLVKIYADFLKEFYAANAPYVFYEQSQKSSLMQQVMPTINWHYFDGGNFKSKSQCKTASVNGNLGTVYKALHEGNVEKAYALGHERINSTSVFERYPALRQKVECAYHAVQAKIKHDRIVQENVVQQKAAVVQVECSEHALTKLHLDTLQSRYDAATRNILHSQFSKKIHNVTSSQAIYFETKHLTADRKGILLEGGHLQHHFVDEAITIVDVAISGNLVENMQDAVVDLANASLSLNKDGDVVMASRTLDACWALIDFAKDAARYTYSALSMHVPLLAKGTCDGICESLHGAAHAVCHPVETAKDVAHSFVVAGYYVGKLAYANCVLDAAADLLETDPKRYEQMIQQYAIDPEALVAVYQNISTEDIARVGTKTAVDMMLLHGVTKVVSAIAAESLPTFLSCMRKGGESAEVALTAEGVPVRCTEEVACMMSSMENAGANIAVEVIDAGAKNAVTQAEATIESAHATVKRYGKQGSPYQKISKSKQHAKSLDKLEGKDLLGIDNIVMSGYGPLPKKILLDNYKHYLQPELRITSKGKIKPSGWHHDPGRRVEIIKRINGHKIEIENYKKHASGIYKFEWGVEGMQKKRSTFFPHMWSRELVQNKICEAYKYARKYKIAPKFQNRTNNFLLFGFTKDGIKIEMIINQQGTIVSAYPCM